MPKEVPAMRILLAIDGSAPAGHAIALVDHIAWPAGSVIRVVAALEHGSDLVGNPHIPPLHAGSGGAAPAELGAASGGGVHDVELSLVQRLEQTLDSAVLELEAPGRTVERMLLRGRAASAIVEEAATSEADLVVVGHRGHGRIQSMLLGSVSAEVVDRAPCPVLVARAETVASVILAADGSACAEHAERFLLEHHVFGSSPVRVLTVAEVGIPWSSGMAPGVYDQVIESYADSVDEARAQCEAIARQAADHLAAAGYAATPETREGDPAGEIIAAATAGDLIVTGTRGHRGLTRLVLGSTARKLLVHAPCSVLIIRETVPVEAREATAGDGSGT
jgi:nucleotide-binding universal stress UspA family protein